MKKAKSQSESEPSELASVVGERIRKIRRQKGLSLEIFALRCNMNSAYIGHIERGIRNPTLFTLDRICKGLGISIEDLFKDTPVNLNAAVMRHLGVSRRLLAYRMKYLNVLTSDVPYRSSLSLSEAG